MQGQTPLTTYLPTKKFLLVLLALLFIGAGAFFYSQRAGGGGIEGNVAGADKKTDILERLTIDSDMDGLKDWEELLAGSDPNKKDTDGDGTEDGEEARAGRNPTVKGPSDYISDEQREESSIKEKAAGTEMERIFQTMFAAELVLRKGGTIPGVWGGSASGTLALLAEKEITAYTAKIVPLDSVSLRDIRIVEDSSPEALRAYGNAAGAALVKYDVPFGTDPDILIIRNALAANSEEMMGGLDQYVAYYSKTASELLAIRVPRQAAEGHANLINGLSGLAGVMKAMRGVFEDPFSAAAGFKRYEKVVVVFASALDEIQAVFEKNNVVFADKEPGTVFAPAPQWVNDAIADTYIKSGIPLNAAPGGTSASSTQP